MDFFLEIALIAGWIFMGLCICWIISANVEAHQASAQAISKQQKQIDTLTRELEEVKRKLEN